MSNNFEDWVRLLVQNAKALRDAGVTRLRIGDAEADIAPKEGEIRIVNSDTGEDFSDPLSDPATYGHRNGAGAPGFPRIEEGLE